MASISQLTARLVDLFGTPSTANPAKLAGNLTVTPNGNVLVGTASESTTTNKLQVSGGIVVNSYDTGSYAQIRAVQGNYGAMLRNDGTSCSLVSTASGSQYGTYNAYRPFQWNMSTGAVGIAMDGSALTVGGTATFDSVVTLTSTGQYSPNLVFSGNGYAPLIRSNSTATQLEFANSGNTALNVTISDAGVVSFPRARPSWSGYTPWDSGNFTPSSYMPVTGGTFTGGVTVSGAMNAYGYWTRAGYAGTSSGNTFNLYWSGGLCYLYIDNTQIGAISTTSDARLKHSITDSDNGLDRLNQLRPVKYRYRDTGIFKDDGEHEGFLAQDVEQVVPSAVHGEPGAVDKAGEIQPQVLEPLPLISLTVKAVQELSDKLDEAIRRITSLEAQIQAQIQAQPVIQGKE